MGTNPFPFGCGTVCCLVLMVAATAFASVPLGEATTEHVDSIELNHFWPECSDESYPLTHKYAFSQYLFRSWNRDTSTHDIIAWKMKKDGISPPRYDHERGVWVMTFNDGLKLRRITAGSFVETRSTFDPEIAERERLPVERRRGLR